MGEAGFCLRGREIWRAGGRQQRSSGYQNVRRSRGKTNEGKRRDWGGGLQQHSVAEGEEEVSLAGGVDRCRLLGVLRTLRFCDVQKDFTYAYIRSYALPGSQQKMLYTRKAARRISMFHPAFLDRLITWEASSRLVSNDSKLAVNRLVPVRFIAAAAHSRPIHATNTDQLRRSSSSNLRVAGEKSEAFKSMTRSVRIVR